MPAARAFKPTTLTPAFASASAVLSPPGKANDGFS